MSFWAKTKIQCKNLSLMTKVCDREGLAVTGRSTHHEIAGTDYDITFQQGNYPRRVAELRHTNEAGTYDLWMESDYNRVTGKDPNMLTRGYAEEVLRYEAEKNGWRIEERKEAESGEILYEFAVNM